jgi:hypothetical protein
MYGYESSATLSTDRSHYNLQTSLLVREVARRRRAKQLSGKRKKIEKSGRGPQGVPTDRRSQHQRKDKARDSIVVKTLCYKSEGHGFGTR